MNFQETTDSGHQLLIASLHIHVKNLKRCFNTGNYRPIDKEFSVCLCVLVIGGDVRATVSPRTYSIQDRSADLSPSWKRSAIPGPHVRVAALPARRTGTLRSTGTNRLVVYHLSD